MMVSPPLQHSRLCSIQHGEVVAISSGHTRYSLRQLRSHRSYCCTFLTAPTVSSHVDMTLSPHSYSACAYPSKQSRCGACLLQCRPSWVSISNPCVHFSSSAPASIIYPPVSKVQMDERALSLKFSYQVLQ